MMMHFWRSQGIPEWMLIAKAVDFAMWEAHLQSIPFSYLKVPNHPHGFICP